MLIRFCKNKKVEKMIAIMLVITMTFANIALLGKNLISYASDENLEIQGVDTQHSNVKFDAYFSDDGGRNVHSVVFDATNNVQKMNLYISVKNVGYIKDAYIDFRDEDGSVNTNYEISGDALNTTLVQNVNTDLKTLSLNYINSGTETVLEMPIKFEMSNMTELNKLSRGSFILFRGIYVDQNGKETQIFKTVKVNLGWNLDTELNIEQAITKYVPYSYSEQTGLILQTSIKLKQDREDKVLPVKSTEIKMKVPEIDGKLPEKITVSPNSMMATNGNKVEFLNDDFKYDEEEKTITIQVQGYEEAGYVWSGIGTDEYFITYMYSNDVYEYALENEINLHCEAEAKMQLYSPEGVIEKNATSEGDVTIGQKIGEIVTYNIEAKNDELSKGKIYANYNSEEKIYDTEYEATIKVNISNSEIVDEMYMQLPCDNFANEENVYTTKIDEIGYTNYKQIIINKDKMQKIFGEDGIITIYDNYSNEYIIDNQTEDVDGNYIIDFEDGIYELNMRLPKPVEDGILEINTTKILSKDLAYTKEQVQQVSMLKLNTIGYTRYSGILEYSEPQTVEDSINLTETTTNAKIEISNTSLSSMVENKNVEIKIELNNNEETSDLYRNSVFMINLPKYIENIEITGGNILYTSGLEVDYVEILNTENGLALKVVTKGAEDSFSSGSFTNGTNIVLNANIKVNSLTPNISDKIKMIYTNENVTSYVSEEDGYGVDSIDVTFVSPEEMVTFNSILASGVEATSTEGNEEVAKVEILDSSKVATMKISILNKYSNICNNIRILGRTPFIGNKEINTGSDLGTTFDAKLISAINTNGIDATVYYSENENATEDLEDELNGWTTNLSSIENVKSYLIILPNHEMQVGEMLEFSYDCAIPQGLEHNESAYGTYVVYYDSVSEYTAPNSVEASKVGLTTGIGSNIETSTEVIYQGKTASSDKDVAEQQYITYKTKVKNTGTINATGVEIENTINNATITKANGATIDENKLKWELGEIKAGEEKTVEYTVKVEKRINIDTSMVIDEISTDGSGNTVTNYYVEDEQGNRYPINIEDLYKIYNIINVTAENFEGKLEEYKSNHIKTAEFEIKLQTNYMENTFSNGVEFAIGITVSNLQDKNLNNVVIYERVPEGLKYVPKDSENGNIIEYNEETRMLTIRINNMEAYANAGDSVTFITELPSNVGRLNAINVFTVSANGTDEYQSSELEIEVCGPILNINMSANITNGSYIKTGNQIRLTVVAKNTGKSVATSSSINVNLPSELIVSSATYSKSGQETQNLNKTSDNIYYAIEDIGVGETVTLNIIATAKLYNNIEEKTVNINSDISASRTEKIQSNALTYIIEKSNEQYDPTDPNYPSNPGNPSVPTYKITGTAWLDENEDGIKNENEKLLEGIDVLLINASTGVIVTDRTNGTLKQTKTMSDGSYKFDNLVKGKYIVIFEYDSAFYDVTEYKKSGATDDTISKAIQTKINKDGKIKIAGATDTINLTNSTANINIGLVEKPKFDLSLEKSISKIIVQNAKGISTYDFANTKLAKVEIPGNYVKGSIVHIEYRIKIKNEGAVPGYATKIVDYMSKDFEFDQNSNLTWYMGADGNLYNDSLDPILIKPGESQELVLVLKKTMTDGNTGLTTNKAEIYESYNEQNLKDYNSTPGNNAQGENDLDYADAIISVKTGQIALYITITVISIMILATGAYFINKKVLKGGRA